MVAVRSEEPICPDFDVVLAALESYTRRTGRAPARLGGWEVEDEVIRPPAALEERIGAITGRLHDYAYARHLGRAKDRAAEVLGPTIRHAGGTLTRHHVAVLQNSTQALLLALAALKGRDVERLVIAAPCYYAPVRIAQTLGLAVEVVPAADYLTAALDVAALRAAASQPGAALLVTNPAYSVGVEYGWSRLDQLFAALPPGLPILLDETRLGLSWRSSAPWYRADFPANVAVLRSPSKVFLINGAKCGLLLAAPHLVRTVEQLSEALVGSVAGNAEGVALAYLDAWERWARERETGQPGDLLLWREGVVERLRRGFALAAGLLGAAGFALAPADSGPYALAAIPRSRHWGLVGLDSRLLAEEAGVLVMDGSYFLHTSDAWVGLRLNLCGDRRAMPAAIGRMLRHLAGGPKHDEPSMARRQAAAS